MRTNKGAWTACKGLVLLPLLLLVAACATGVGRWDGVAKGVDTSTLQQQVEQSLRDQQWMILTTATGATRAIKAGKGGQRTVADFTYTTGASEGGGSGAVFQLNGASHHTVNWLTFGILGLSMQKIARNVCVEWYETWVKGHPAK